MKKTPALFILLLCVSFPCISDDGNGYIEPHELTNAQWDDINGQIYNYNACLREEMVKWTEKGNDPRAVSDQVLDICSSHLLKLQKDMNDNNINPHFTERFIYTNKNRAARKMLGAIMIMMSQQQAKQSESEQQNTDEATTSDQP